MSWPRAVTATRLAAADKTARQTPAACGVHGTVTRGRTARTAKSVPSRVPGRRDPDSRSPPPPQAGRLFFATRQAAEDHLHRGERERAGQAAREAPYIKEMRRAMADAHPDRGGTAEQFIEAHRRYRDGASVCDGNVPLAGPADTTAPREEQMTVPAEGLQVPGRGLGHIVGVSASAAVRSSGWPGERAAVVDGHPDGGLLIRRPRAASLLPHAAGWAAVTMLLGPCVPGSQYCVPADTDSPRRTGRWTSICG